ncbi:MAG TPA: VanZ family protein [Rhodocyclaceae bacterium]
MPDSLAPRPTRLAGGLALSAAALIAAGSLYPFSGWQSNGLPPWAFLFSGWPRYWTGNDLAVNVLAYLPLGTLVGIGLSRRLRSLPAALAAWLSCVLLSLVVEMLQHYLPSRIPSQFDLICNAAGAALGVGLATWRARPLLAIEDRLATVLARVPHPAYGLALLALWLLTQLSADAVFGTTGDLRRIFGAPAAGALSLALPLEALAVACHLVLVGLLANRLFGSNRPALPSIVLCLVSAAACATAARAIWLEPAHAFDWLSPSTISGLLAGSVALLLVLLLPATAMRVAATVALGLGVAAINLLPVHPYQTALAPWQLGAYLNINGLTRWLGVVWPLFALVWLIAGPWQRSRWHETVFRRSL